MANGQLDAVSYVDRVVIIIRLLRKIQWKMFIRVLAPLILGEVQGGSAVDNSYYTKSRKLELSLRLPNISSISSCLSHSRGYMECDACGVL